MSSTLMKSLQVEASEQSLRALYREYGGELYGFAVNVCSPLSQTKRVRPRRFVVRTRARTVPETPSLVNCPWNTARWWSVVPSP